MDFPASKTVLNKYHLKGTFLVVQWLRLTLPVQGVWVLALLGAFRSHMPHGQKNQNIKQKQYCNKFNETSRHVT